MKVVVFLFLNLAPVGSVVLFVVVPKQLGGVLSSKERWLVQHMRAAPQSTAALFTRTTAASPMR